MKTTTHSDRFAVGLAIVVVLSLTAVRPTAIVHAAALRTVAITGQPAAGTTVGVTYESFASHYFSCCGAPTVTFRGPVLNDAGQTAFRANLTGSGVDFMNNQGVWSEGSGNLALVARTGSAAPGGGSFGTYSGLELFTPVINSAGQTGFFGALTDGKLGLWSEGSGSLAVVARDGMHAPVLPTGVNFSFAIIDESNKNIFTDLPLLNDAGQTWFFAYLAGTGVNNTNNSGLWSGVDLNSLAQLARRGTQAPGLPAGVTYGDGQLASGLNDVGQTAFFSYLAGSGVDSSNYMGLWSGSPGSLSPVARMGSPAPGTPSGERFGVIFANIANNNAGKVAFESWLTGGDVVDGVNDEGLWSNVSGSLQLVARRGSQAAGAPAGVNYGQFSLSTNPLLNDSGQLAFHAAIEGAGVDESNNEGIWLGEPGTLTLAARRGQQAPDAPSGVTFSDLHFPSLNSAGQIAFRASVSGDGVDFSNDRGIWATDWTGALQLIARTGDQIEVAPGDFRTLANLDFVASTGNSDGRRSAFNNLGQLAFWASFTDGSQGVFVSNAVAHVPGDFNNDGTVDAADYTIWQDTLGSTTDLRANGDNTGASANVIDLADFIFWKAHFGIPPGSGSGGNANAAVPEPATIALAMIVATLLCARPRAANKSTC